MLRPNFWGRRRKAPQGGESRRLFGAGTVSLQDWRLTIRCSTTGGRS